MRWTGRKDDYESGREPREPFLDSARRFLPGLEPDDLVPGYSGIRPKLSGPGEPARDFEIERRGKIVTVRGIESPGLTAAPALAVEVADMAEE